MKLTQLKAEDLQPGHILFRAGEELEITEFPEFKGAYLTFGLDHGKQKVTLLGRGLVDVCVRGDVRAFSVGKVVMETVYRPVLTDLEDVDAIFEAMVSAGVNLGDICKDTEFPVPLNLLSPGTSWRKLRGENVYSVASESLYKGLGIAKDPEKTLSFGENGSYSLDDTKRIALVRLGDLIPSGAWGDLYDYICPK